jgi:hypothetical protein
MINDEPATVLDNLIRIDPSYARGLARSNVP